MMDTYIHFLRYIEQRRLFPVISGNIFTRAKLISSCLLLIIIQFYRVKLMSPSNNDNLFLAFFIQENSNMIFNIETTIAIV